MLHITSHSQNGERNLLARIRRQARKRGLRVLKDWTGSYNLVDTHIEPPRALVGLEHASLSDIEAAVRTPLPPPRPTRKRPPVERLTEVIEPQPSQASPSAAAAAGFTDLVDLLKGSAS
jgi:hypothetical protein